MQMHDLIKNTEGFWSVSFDTVEGRQMEILFRRETDAKIAYWGIREAVEARVVQ